MNPTKNYPPTVDALHQALGIAPAPTPDGAKSLPQWELASKFLATQFEPRATVIAGVLLRGSKLVIGGASKSRKTWTLLDLATSVASGTKFMDKLDCGQGKVLFVNLELSSETFQKRLKAVIEEKQVQAAMDSILVWNLRGHAAPYETLLPVLRERAKELGLSLVIIDPVYKVYPRGFRENDAGDWADMLRALDAMVREMDVALCLAAHYGKGNKSETESLDRVAGSGVLARDADAWVAMTSHAEPDCLAVEMRLRDFQEPAPFVIRWNYPLHRVEIELDPADLKKSAGRPTARKRPTEQEVQDVFPLFMGDGEPERCLIGFRERRTDFRAKGWNDNEAEGIAKRLVRQGRLAGCTGPRGADLIGRPDAVSAFVECAKRKGRRK